MTGELGLPAPALMSYITRTRALAILRESLDVWEPEALLKDAWLNF